MFYGTALLKFRLKTVVYFLKITRRIPIRLALFHLYPTISKRTDFILISNSGYLGTERDFKRYESNKLLRRAVERELEIIGEATNRIIKIQPDIDISDSRRIVNLRNLVIHSYDNVDNIIIWGIIDKDLPRLKQQVLALLKTTP
jgi:uncharacterized protein with HEPN domain